MRHRLIAAAGPAVRGLVVKSAAPARHGQPDRPRQSDALHAVVAAAAALDLSLGSSITAAQGPKQPLAQRGGIGVMKGV